MLSKVHGTWQVLHKWLFFKSISQWTYITNTFFKAVVMGEERKDEFKDDGPRYLYEQKGKFQNSLSHIKISCGS